VPSQGSDRLRAILASAKEKAQAAQAALPQGHAAAETRGVEALLDRNEALPDPRALARMYRERELVERLPEDEEHTPAPATAAAPGAAAEPARPHLSPAQIRAVMNELQERFTAGTYEVYEPTRRPDEFIPATYQEWEEDVAPPLEAPSGTVYIAGAVGALLIIGVLVLLAIYGPLLSRPPAGATPTPTATVSPSR
jgi:hypothetical protein